MLMRPIELKMSAFGPFAGLTTLKLDALGVSYNGRYGCRKDNNI